MNDRFYELAEKADLPRPEMYSSFVWFRALGDFRKSIADNLGVSVRTLRRWENKVAQNISSNERAELVNVSVSYEFNQRLDNSKKTTEGDKQ